MSEQRVSLSKLDEQFEERGYSDAFEAALELVKHMERPGWENEWGDPELMAQELVEAMCETGESLDVCWTRLFSRR